VAAFVATLAFAAPAYAEGDASSNGGAQFQRVPASVTGAFAGKPTRIAGHVAGGAGQVAVDVRSGKAAWTPVGITSADSAGDFSIDWTPKQAGRFEVRITPLASASTAEAVTLPKISVYRKQKATWYGPGFYGNKTACGQRLRRSTIGVAHRTLPCGTKVEFFNDGKKVVVPVIDRGPFVRGVTWDLTLPAMKRLGSTSTIVLGAVPHR
jgi:rare lipoprotein A